MLSPLSAFVQVADTLFDFSMLTTVSNHSLPTPSHRSTLLFQLSRSCIPSGSKLQRRNATVSLRMHLRQPWKAWRILWTDCGIWCSHHCDGYVGNPVASYFLLTQLFRIALNPTKKFKHFIKNWPLEQQKEVDVMVKKVVRDFRPAPFEQQDLTLL